MINLQSPGPVGLGELLNLPDGNSILTLKNRNGENVDHKLWINDFTSDLNMEIDVAQLRAGYTYRPIRIQERILTFTTIWSLANRSKYEALVESIRENWAYNLNELMPTPAYFTYFGANKTFAGFLLNAERSYTVPDTLLSYSFDMKLINSKMNENVSEVSVYSYYVPRPENVSLDGLENWYSADPSKADKNIIPIYENTVQLREVGSFGDNPPKSSRPPIQETTIERNMRAMLIYFAINEQGTTLEQAIEWADRWMNNPTPQGADYRDGIVNRVKDKDWEQYLDMYPPD